MDADLDTTPEVDAAPASDEAAPVDEGTGEGEFAGGDEPSIKEGVAAAAERALKPKAPIGPQKIKLKFREKGDDGKEQEFEEEFEESQLAEMTRKRRALDKAAFGWAEKAKKLERERDEYEERLALNPWEAIQRRGGDPFKTAMEFLQQGVSYAQMTPEQKQIFHERQELEQLRQLKSQTEEQQKGQQREQQKTAYRDQLLKALPVAMDKFDLPKHPLIMNALNDIGTAHMMKTGAEFPDLEFAAEEVHELLQSANNDRLERLCKTPEKLIKSLPPSVVKAIRAYDVARANGPTRAVGTQQGAPRPAAGREEKPNYQTPQEWRQSLQASVGLK